LLLCPKLADKSDIMASFILCSPKDPEQHQKQIDKVQLQRECPQDSPFSDYSSVQSGRLRKGHIFQLLGVVGRSFKIQST